MPPEHLAWFILEVIEQLDTSALRARSKLGGAGREGYDPDLLLAVWVYASARGIHSSRQIERACSEDVAFRVLCAQDVPDHTVLARFRQAHQDAMADLFAQVLALCVKQGLGRFGVIAIDGTKIKANASKDKTRSLKKLRTLAAAELHKAEVTDAAEDAANTPSASDDLPPGMGPGADRGSRIQAAIRDLEAEIEAENTPRMEKFQHRLDTAKRHLAELETLAATDNTPHLRAEAKRVGRKRTADSRDIKKARRAVDYAAELVEKTRKTADEQRTGARDRTERVLLQRNITDPHSRLMKTRNGFVQGYNGQVAVADDQLILAVEATDEPNDVGQLIPMMAKVEAALQRCAEVSDRTDLDVGMLTADNGYLSEENVSAEGYDRLIAPGRGAMKDGESAGTFKAREGHTPSTAATVMLKKIQEPGNQERYNRRSAIVEPVNGHLKDRRRLRQFSRRGKDAVNAELHFAAMTTNLMKLFTTMRRGVQAAT